MTSRRGIATSIAVMLLWLGSASGTLAAQTQHQWRPFAPSTSHVTGLLSDRRLAEASGAFVSTVNPGLFWTMGDSGNPPTLYAIDSAGTIHATLKVAGASNVDWESLGHSRCGDTDCILIGDTGDNSTRRKSVTIYRVVEPKVERAGAEFVANAERVEFVYPDHPHDTEAIASLADGGVLLVTKGTRGAIVAFTLPGSAWGTGQATARLLDTIPIVARPGVGRLITGAAFSPNRRRLVLRSYGQIFLFDHDPASGRTTPHRWAACGILGLEPQGEGVAWLGSSERWLLLLTSERGLFPSGTVAVVDCTPPRSLGN